MADRNHIRPAIVRGSLVHQVVDAAVAEFRHAACAWSALEAERAIDMEDKLKVKHEAQEVPLRRCDDCRLNLGHGPGDTLHAAFACPMFGKPRAGVVSRCAAFIAKDGTK